jgi:hypothetical protein
MIIKHSSSYSFHNSYQSKLTCDESEIESSAFFLHPFHCSSMYSCNGHLFDNRCRCDNSRSISRKVQPANADPIMADGRWNPIIIDRTMAWPTKRSGKHRPNHKAQHTHTLRASPPPFHGNYFKSNRRRTGSDTSMTSSTSLSIVFVAARSSWVA